MKADEETENEKIVMRLLEESSALRRGHFLLSSGLHATAYVQCALLLEDPVRARKIGQDLAELLRTSHPDSVLSPALGGVIIGHEVAAALGVPFRFTERKGDEMGFRRGFELRQGERVVIVEDVVTTGRSTLETAALATSKGARVVSIGSIIDRTVGRDPFDVPFRALLKLDLPSYTPQECPACQAGADAPEKPGSRPDPALTPNPSPGPPEHALPGRGAPPHAPKQVSPASGEGGPGGAGEGAGE